MVKLTVQQYANQVEISATAVYKQVKNKVINSVKENGKIYVLVEDTEMNPSSKQVNNDDCMELITKLLKQLKDKDKEIKRITKELSKTSKDKEQTLLTYISELKNFQLEYKPKENIEVVTTSDDKKKKSKKKKDKNDK